MDNPTISWRITEATGNALAAGADIPGVVAAAFTALAEHHRERATWLADNRKKGWKSTGEMLTFAAEQLESAAGELENGEAVTVTDPAAVQRCASFRRATDDDPTVCTLLRGHPGDHFSVAASGGDAAWPRKHSGEQCNVAMTHDESVRCSLPLGHADGHQADDPSGVTWLWTYGTEPVRHDPADDPNTAEDDAAVEVVIGELDAARAVYDAATDEMVALGAHADCVYVDGVCTLAGRHRGTADERAEDDVHPNQCASTSTLDGRTQRCVLTAQPPHTGNHISATGGRWPQGHRDPAEPDPPREPNTHTFTPDPAGSAPALTMIEHHDASGAVVAVEHVATMNSGTADTVLTEVDPATVNITIGTDGGVHSSFTGRTEDGRTITVENMPTGSLGERIPAQRTEEPASMDAANPFGPVQPAAAPPGAALVPFRAPSIVVPLLPKAPVTEREHDSVSSIETMAGCGMKYRLKYHENAPELPAWWLVGGKTLHCVIEEVERNAAKGITMTTAQAEGAWAEAFAAEIERTELATGVPRKHWKAAKGTKAGGPENEAWWAENGKAMSVRYLIGRRALTEDGWELLRNGAGDLALELEFRFPLGFAGRAIRGFIDSVWINRAKQMVLVVDDKSGARPAESTFQLETYGAAVRELLQGSDMAAWPVLGTYYNARKGEYSARIKIDTEAAATIADARSAMTWQAERAGVFLPRVTNMCKGCGVAASCPVMALKASTPLEPVAAGTDVEAPEW